jgi:hypothetical protein
LTQLNDSVVLKPEIETVAYLLGDGDMPVETGSLRTNWWPNQQIAISNGTNDAGMFELSFGDHRYLPFERTGAVSSWRLAMPPQTNHFDFATITDVILNLRYTALDGGAKLRRDVTGLPSMATYDGAVFLPLRQYYPDAWHQFMTAHPDPNTQTLAFDVPPSVIPRHISDAQLTGFFLQLYLADGTKITADAEFMVFNASAAPGGSVPVKLTAQAYCAYSFTAPLDFSGVSMGARTLAFDLAKTPSDLKKDGYLDPTKVVGVGLVLDYQGTVDWK